MGSTRQAEQQDWEGVLVSEGQAAVRAWGEDVGSLALPPTGFRSALWCLTGFWVFITILPVRKLPALGGGYHSNHPCTVATKETVAMTMAARYKRQMIGYQFHLETDSSSPPPPPSATNC